LRIHDITTTEVIFKLPNTVIGYAILPSATILSYFVSRGSMIRENILSIVIPAFNNQTSLCCLSKKIASLEFVVYVRDGYCRILL